MKKLLLGILVCIGCFFCLNVKAAEVNNFKKFSEAATSLYTWTGFYADVEKGENYFFDEGKEVNPFVIWQYMAYANADYFEDYAEYDMFTDPDSGETYPLEGTFSVPAELFESVLLKTFDVDMEYIETKIRTECQLIMGEGCGYTKVGEDYFYNYKTPYGFGFAPDTIDLPLGYKDLGKGYYEMYSYIGAYCANYPIDYAKNPDAECEKVTPSDKDVYGEDYVVEFFEYTDEDGNDVYDYQPLKVVGYVKVKLYYDGEYIKFVSIGEITKKDMVKKSELVKEDTPSVETKKDDITINADKGVFVNGTKVTVDKITDGTMFEVVTKALKEKATEFVVYDINAKAGTYDVQPNGKVKISIKVPSHYKNAVIYYVAEDGTLEKMNTEVKDGYAVAELEHFSAYALVDEKKEDNPDTSVFHKIDIILSVVLIFSFIIYKLFRKTKRYYDVKL